MPPYMISAEDPQYAGTAAAFGFGYIRGDRTIRPTKVLPQSRFATPGRRYRRAICSPRDQCAQAPQPVVEKMDSLTAASHAQSTGCARFICRWRGRARERTAHSRTALPVRAVSGPRLSR